MKSLAKGSNSDAIFKLIKVLISTQQQDYAEAIGGDTDVLGDIADNIESNQQLFQKSEIRPAGMMDHSFLNFDAQEQEDEMNESGMMKGVPAYVMDQINS